MGADHCDFVTTPPELLVQEPGLERSSVRIGYPQEITEDCDAKGPSSAMGQCLERVSCRRLGCGLLDSLNRPSSRKVKKRSRILVGHRVGYVSGRSLENSRCYGVLFTSGRRRAQPPD